MLLPRGEEFDLRPVPGKPEWILGTKLGFDLV